MRLTALALILAVPVAAQQTPTGPAESRADRFMRNCDDYGDRNREQVCEVRDVTMKAPTRALIVDGGENGDAR